MSYNNIIRRPFKENVSPYLFSTNTQIFNRLQTFRTTHLLNFFFTSSRSPCQRKKEKKKKTNPIFPSRVAMINIENESNFEGNFSKRNVIKHRNIVFGGVRLLISKIKYFCVNGRVWGNYYFALLSLSNGTMIKR